MTHHPNRPTWRQAACLLLASVGLGLASNALHPAGLRWGEASGGRGLDGAQSAAGWAGIYRNETLYKNETFSTKPAPRDGQVAAANAKLVGDEGHNSRSERLLPGNKTVAGLGSQTSHTLSRKDQSLLTSAPTLAAGSALPAGGSTLANFPTQASTPRRSTWAEVKPLVESGQMVLVDARPRTAFDAGHIPGAVCLPFKNLQAEILSFMAAHPPSTPLAIYCANASCGTSSQMATALTQTYQYKDVRYLPGGYQEWRKAEGK